MLTPDVDETELSEGCCDSLKQHAANFEALGVQFSILRWSRAPLPLSSTNTVYVANLAWGYHTKISQWNLWLQSWPKSVHLINDPELLAWNTSKAYLKDLQDAGIPILPTVFVDFIDESILIEASKNFGVSDIIVKPQVSASGDNTYRVLIDSDNIDSVTGSVIITRLSLGFTNFLFVSESISRKEAIHRLKSTAEIGPFLVQPFMKSIWDEGEISVVVFDGQISHSVTKKAKLCDYRVQMEYGGTVERVEQLDSAVVDLVNKVLMACPKLPVYARVDILRNTLTGLLSIMELEIIEPGFYLSFAPDNGLAFAKAIIKASTCIQK